MTRWAQSVESRPLGHSRCHWILEGLSAVVLWVDSLFSPFKLEDWRDRARAAETAAAAAQAQVMAAEHKIEQARQEAINARATLAEFRDLHESMRAVINSWP